MKIIFDIRKSIIYYGNSYLKKQSYLNSQTSHTKNIALQAEASSGLDNVDGMLLLFVISLLSLFISATVSNSPSVEIIGLNSILGVLGLLIILPILISGIINLILIIR